MATSSSFSPSGTLADDPVSQPRSIAQPSPTDFYKHESLDHSLPSIRLLKISPILSAEGLIQCSMLHTTIEHAPYRCLSYAWGQPEPKQLVLIDGKQFYVQPNLFEFLKVTRADTERTAYTYWVDAICIDQNNTAERNHQVMQMGRIYSGAETVIAWLGLASAETVLAYHTELQPRLDADSWETRSRARKARRAVSRDLLWNDYWNRAWITQELKLARCIVVAIGSLTIAIIELQSMIRGLPSGTFEAADQVFALTSSHKVIGSPLASLLLTFRNKRCSVVRDRIFSLLALCSETNAIKVDYGCSVFDLVYSIAKSNERTLCACSTLVVMQSLAPEIDELPPDSDCRSKKGPYVEIEANGADWVHIRDQNKCAVLDYICSHVLVTETRFVYGATSCGRKHVIAPRTSPLGKANAYSAYPIEPKSGPFPGRSFAAIGPGCARIRISLWYLFDLYSKEQHLRMISSHICSRSTTGTNEFMTSIRVGYGNWDINASVSPPEGPRY